MSVVIFEVIEEQVPYFNGGFSPEYFDIIEKEYPRILTDAFAKAMSIEEGTRLGSYELMGEEDAFNERYNNRFANHMYVPEHTCAQPSSIEDDFPF